MNTNMKVQDLINNDYRAWQVSSVKCLDCCTGSGKTTFALEILAKWAAQNGKRILYLAHRTKLKGQILEKIYNLKLKNVVVELYQGLTSGIRCGKQIGYYDYIIYDECHYITDEGWNGISSEVLDFFKDTKDNCISIFMSATADNLFQFFKDENYINDSDVYTINADYNSIIEKLIFYNDNNDIEFLLNNLKQGEKAIFFCKTLKDAYELHLKYKDNSNFVCSTNNKQYGKYSEDCIKNNKFDKQILFCTTVIDAGIDIDDSSIKYIITDLTNKSSIIQCIGRRRIQGTGDTFTLYIKNRDKKSISSALNTLRNNTLSVAEKYLKDPQKFYDELDDNKELEEKVKRENSCFTKIKLNKNDINVHETKHEVMIGGNFYAFNKIKYRYYKSLEKHLIKLKEMGDIDKNTTAFYIDLMMELDANGDFDMGKVEFTAKIKKQKKNNDLFKYLDSIVGKKLFKEGQQELKQKFREIGIKTRTIGIHTINGHIKDTNLPFIIVPKKSNGKRYWEVINNIAI